MRGAINIAALLVLATLAVGLYKAKTEAEDDRSRAVELEMLLAEERESIRVMRNEVGYLENPERLRQLAGAHLGLVPIDPLRVVTLEDAPLLIEAPAPVIEAPPTASVTYTDDEP